MGSSHKILETKLLYHCLKRLIHHDLREVMEPITHFLQSIYEHTEDLKIKVDAIFDTIKEDY